MEVYRAKTHYLVRTYKFFYCSFIFPYVSINSGGSENKCKCFENCTFDKANSKAFVLNLCKIKYTLMKIWPCWVT